MVSRSALFFAFHLFLAPKLCLSNHQLLLKRFLFIRGGSGAGLESDAAILVADRPSTTTMTAPASTASMEVVETGSFKQDNKENSLLIVFSDLDGTLIHYPEPLLDQERGPSEADSTILQLPPSSTGMVGVISTQTLIKCQSIRRLGVKLVLVSGMRSSTLLKRLPYLPRADAYCCEAGGRIYYPTILPSSLNASQAEEDGTYHRIVPIPYDGADPSDLQPFFLQEDSQWRSLMERSDAAGLDGFAGSGDRVAPVPLEQRKGALWAFARLLKERGLVLDTQGYATCFRVNKNQQISEESRLLFDKLLSGEIEHPTELATSVNLGCIDFYPAISGKKQCCEYLTERFGGSKELLSTSCVCLCDDDNDVEMAMACAHAYIPSVSSESMSAIIRANPTKFTETFRDRQVGVLASEAALSLVLERITSGAQ